MDHENIFKLATAINTLKEIGYRMFIIVYYDETLNERSFQRRRRRTDYKRFTFVFSVSYRSECLTP
jgi:hypothetical protein